MTIWKKIKGIVHQKQYTVKIIMTFTDKYSAEDLSLQSEGWSFVLELVLHKSIYFNEIKTREDLCNSHITKYNQP